MDHLEELVQEHVNITLSNITNLTYETFITNWNASKIVCHLSDHHDCGTPIYHVIQTNAGYIHLNLCNRASKHLINKQKELYVIDIVSHRARLLGNMFMKAVGIKNPCAFCSKHSKVTYKHRVSLAWICINCKLLSIQLICFDVILVLTHISVIRDIQVHIVMLIRESCL